MRDEETSISGSRNNVDLSRLASDFPLSAEFFDPFLHCIIPENLGTCKELYIDEIRLWDTNFRKLTSGYNWWRQISLNPPPIKAKKCFQNANPCSLFLTWENLKNMSLTVKDIREMTMEEFNSESMLGCCLVMINIFHRSTTWRLKLRQSVFEIRNCEKPDN